MKPIINNNARILLLFRHGLGDCVQFTSVIKHLKHYYPDSFIAVAAKPGRENVFNGLADQTYPLQVPKEWIDEKWDVEINVAWNRPTKNYPGLPNSKITESLLNEFGLTPRLELYDYEIDYTKELVNASIWLGEILKPWNDSDNTLPPFALIHPYSETSTEDKNLTNEETEYIANHLKWDGIIPIIIDYDCRYQSWRKCEQFAFLDGEFNAQRLLALSSMATCFYGIDSGPAHLAACLRFIPSVIFWKGTSAPYCFDPAPNCLHVVPADMASRLHKERALETMDYFNKHFNNVPYHKELLTYLQAGKLPYVGSVGNVTFAEYDNAPVATWGWRVSS